MEQTTEFEPKLTYQLKTAETPAFLDQGKERTPSTPGEWFSARFPEQASKYGPPLLEAVYVDVDLRIPGQIGQ
jgi:hypothetical protein